MIFATEDHPAVPALRARMDAFYTSTGSYSAFQATSRYRDEWGYAREAIEKHLKVQPDCRVLEFGAGRTGFAEFLGELRRAVHFTAHDVTPANLEFLRTQADEVCIGAITSVTGTFDVIFSTFVLEHVSDPRNTLEILFGLLKPGGVLFLFCPRYDFPFYLSHSADHYDLLLRVRVSLTLLLQRCRTIFTGQPAFTIHLDPSLFHLPWSMDRDAIHWVSLFDLRILFASRARLKSLTVSTGSTKDWIVKHWLRINLAIEKPICAHG